MATCAVREWHCVRCVLTVSLFSFILLFGARLHAAGEVAAVIVERYASAMHIETASSCQPKRASAKNRNVATA
ncbi:hypothetical protein ACLKA7_004281 [Drosophila subpalustris]